MQLDLNKFNDKTEGKRPLICAPRMVICVLLSVIIMIKKIFHPLLHPITFFA